MKSSISNSSDENSKNSQTPDEKNGGNPHNIVMDIGNSVALIRKVEPIKASIPLTETSPEQMWVQQWSRQLYVKIVSDGSAGWGEVLATAGNDPTPYYEMIRTLSPVVVGTDASDPMNIWKTLQRYVFSGGSGITTGAISGIDIGVWDLKARVAGQSLYAMLGGQGRKIKRYFSLSRYKRSDLVAAVRNLLDSGYRSIKIHQSPGDTLEGVREIREQLGYEFDLMADINCGFGLNAAKAFATEISRFELKWIEEPIWPPDDYDSLSFINKIIPVAAGENLFTLNEFKRVVEMDALTYYQPDITKAGGITAALDIIKLLRDAGKSISFHCRPYNGWVGIAATAHVASALAPESLLETPPNCIPDGLFENTNDCEKEFFLPQGPGHGVTPREPLPELNQGGLLRFHD